jgi:nucleoprotein TPR
LDAAEDRAAAAESAARRAELERFVLAEAESRAAEKAARAMSDKAKLEVARDAALAVKTAREEELGRERERLATEVARLQKEWALSRGEVETERDRLRDANAAKDAVAEKASLRATEDETRATKLREDRADAEQRAQVAEAKVVLLEQQVTKAEERLRAATYARVASHSVSAAAEAAGVVAGALASDGSPVETPREMELLAAAVRAGEDAAAAKEAAAAANAHVAHYRAIAEANDATVKEMQGAFDALRAETSGSFWLVYINSYTFSLV